MTSESIYEYDLGQLANEIETGCTFCSQFKDRSNLGVSGIIFGEDFNRVLYQDEHFVVVPALGQIVEGYLLIVARNHYNSIANIPEELQQSFLHLKEKVVSVLAAEYSKPVFFEHGSLSSHQLGGACINHAHLHAVPINIDFRDFLSETLNVIQINSIQDLWNLKPNFTYLFFELEKNKAFYAKSNEFIPCQYFRRIIAEYVARPNEWNWRLHIGKDKVKATIKRLRGKFEDIESP